MASQMKHSRIGCLYVGFLIQIIISLLVTSTIKTKANLSQTFFYYFPLPLFIPSCNMYLKNLWLIQYCLLMCPFQRIFQHVFFSQKKSYDFNSQAVASSLCFQLPGLQLRGVANALDGLWELWSTGGALLRIQME